MMSSVAPATKEIRSAQPNNQSKTKGQKEKAVHAAFIGGIPLQATKEDLVKYLSSFGVVKRISLPTDNYSETHKGFAKVFFDSEDSLLRAVGFYDHFLFGVKIGISKWVSRSQHVSLKESPSENKVFFRFQSYLEKSVLHRYFMKFGPVESLEIKKNYLEDSNRDFGFVVFESSSSARQLIQLGPRHQVQGVRIFVQQSMTNRQIAKDIKHRLLQKQQKQQGQYQKSTQDDSINEEWRPAKGTKKGEAVMKRSIQENSGSDSHPKRALNNVNPHKPESPGTLLSPPCSLDDLKEERRARTKLLFINTAQIESTHRRVENVRFNFEKNPSIRRFILARRLL